MWLNAMIMNEVFSPQQVTDTKMSSREDIEVMTDFYRNIFRLTKPLARASTRAIFSSL